ncbi:glycine cleavage system aminomethyltransferase GcvT [Propioniciclava soli]|uniref:Aminomethyltransferase n=1 Tax=Propioniciclava soli TaxID=2775081 RepID=A0ABZ3C5I5_9ACTN|nr:glycine cleavage system aminomethyltransferase GcvT [Propioniciclava soli]
MADLLTSPLHDRHVALGAKFAEFGGWSMPLQYAGVVAEHHAVRQAVGVFDVSHLGKARISGPGARAFVNACLTNDLDRIGPGQAQYTLCCAPDGGVVDDLIVYLRADDDVFCIPNAANTAEVVRLLAEAAPEGLTVENQHAEFAVIAVQGPLSDDVLTALGVDAEFDYMQFRTGRIADAELTVCRTGYTGERGYELVCRSEDAGAVWDAVMAAGADLGITPCGLGARDTLRTEMGYALHGHELSPEITPVMAGLVWAVGWDKPTFWGADALRAERAAGPSRRLRALQAPGRAIPRPGMDVVDADGAVIGTVTSGTFSPTLTVGIGLALLDPPFKPGSEVGVAVRNRIEPFSVEKAPLVTPQVRA